ncbi:unnamed protein product [Medioppia subpectinata]|uniref:Hydroxylysine kinase n=1 Tax=Medioppia subpectinata TaxID=1979941 RepID=A0A7R9KTY8_9ACAR|nr:unnamed protein product [Medioppia subpectinata]CAG2108399.1 unnamed protein product [Medioppia subpectinata]
MNQLINKLEYVKVLVKRLFKHEVKQIKELNGAEDRNYHLVTTDSHEFVLKITNSEESSEVGLLDAVNEFILHLHKAGFEVTVPQLNTCGKYVSFETIPTPDHNSPDNNHEVYGIRLLAYISGQLLRNVSFTPSLLTECGRVLAQMTIALQTFESQVLRDGRQSAWSLLRVLDIRQHLDAVQSATDRAIVSAVLDEFERTVWRRLDSFEYRFIHGDYNEMNIIVDKVSDDRDYHVKGVIDFNDCQYAPRVFDLAIYLAYSTLMFTAGPQILAPGFGLKGYLELIKLNENEFNTCVKARLCQSLVLCAQAYHQNPTNVYHLSSAKTGWPALRALHECQPQDILHKWLDIDRQI